LRRTYYFNYELVRENLFGDFGGIIRHISNKGGDPEKVDQTAIKINQIYFY